MLNKKTFVIAIANHKGGCGKTTTTVNLAAEFAKLNLSVLVIDLDPQANASLHIGKQHPSEVNYTSAEILLSEPEKLPLAIHEETSFENVSLIYGSLALGNAEDRLKEEAPRPSEELKEKIAPLIGLYDIILIDCPPSLKLLSSNALAVATHYIIPIESGSQYGMYGVTDLIKHVQKIHRINANLKLLGALLIRHDDRQTVCKIIENSAKEQFGKLIPVKIPTSTKINQAAMMKTNISKLDRTAKVSREFRKLAYWIVNELAIKIDKKTMIDEHDSESEVV